MCFSTKLSKKKKELKERFNAEIEQLEIEFEENYFAFTFPLVPVITNKDPDKIQQFQWGLIPKWAKDDSIKKMTLNAKVETISEKPAFRDSVKNRCLVLSDGFFEWQWLDEKGKNKQKYLLSLKNNEAFAMAGLWCEWINKATGEIHKTFTILTTEANELMSRIHNSKKRMPIVLGKEIERKWLMGEDVFVGDVELIATKI